MTTASDPSGNVATFDREATIRAYELRVCDMIGIDVLKEGETTQLTRTSSGLYLYMGEMHFIGAVDIRRRTPEGVPFRDGSKAAWSFGTGIRPTVPDAFGDHVAAVQYELELPWVIQESPDLTQDETD